MHQWCKSKPYDLIFAFLQILYRQRWNTLSFGFKIHFYIICFLLFAPNASFSKKYVLLDLISYFRYHPKEHIVTARLLSPIVQSANFTGPKAEEITLALAKAYDMGGRSLDAFLLLEAYRLHAAPSDQVQPLSARLYNEMNTDQGGFA